MKKILFFTLTPNQLEDSFIIAFSKKGLPMPVNMLEIIDIVTKEWCSNIKAFAHAAKEIEIEKINAGNLIPYLSIR